MLIQGPNLNREEVSADFKLVMGQHQIDRTVSYKYLGVTIYEKLNWKVHIKELCAQLASGCGVLSKVRHYLDRKSLMLIHHAIFESRLCYAILGWGTASEYDLAKVRVVQNKAVRLITFSSFRSSVSPVYSSLKILPLNEQFFVQKSIFMHSLHYQTLPFALSVYCQIPDHKYSTRYATSLNYVLPRVVTNRGQSSIKFSGPKTWFNVPNDLKEIAFRKPFSKKIKEHILKKIYVNLPKKAQNRKYNELKELFEDNSSDDDEFFGFDENESIDLEILFLNESNDSDTEFFGFKINNSDDLQTVFQSDGESENQDFLGFTSNGKDRNLEILFLNDSEDGDFFRFLKAVFFSLCNLCFYHSGSS